MGGCKCLVMELVVQLRQKNKRGLNVDPGNITINFVERKKLKKIDSRNHNASLNK